MATRRRNNTKHHKMSKKEQKLWKKILFWLFIGWWFYIYKFVLWDIPKWIIKTVKNKKQGNDMVDINNYSGQTPKNKRKMSLTEIIVIFAGSLFGLIMLVGVITVITTPGALETLNDESSISTPSIIESSVDTSVDESSSEPSVIESSIEESKAKISIVESSVQPAPEPTLHTFNFILNTDSKKYHTYECAAVKRMSADKRLDITKSAYSLDEAKRMVEADGYTLCGICD